MNQKLVTEALELIGYKKLKAHVFRFEKSTADCEHLLLVEAHGKVDRYLTADFCLHNADAEVFAMRALRKYGDPLFKAWSTRELACLMRFSVGEALAWAPGAAYWQRQVSDQSFADAFAQSIKEGIVPMITTVNSTRSLLEVLVSDMPPFSWVKCNGAIRAAEIVFLSSRERINQSDIRSQLRPYSEEISVGLGVRPSLDAFEFVDAAIADASPFAMH